jgi:opacity protein-like surface antigen
MTRRLTNVVLLLGTCFLLSNNAFAQLKDNLELNVFGAGSMYSKNNFEIGFPQSASPIPGNLKFDAAARFGVRLGVYTRGHWGEEFFYSFEQNSAQISRGGATTASIDLPIRVSNYGINALYYLQETETHTLQPFLSAGIGGTLYQLKPGTALFARDPARGNIPDIDNSNELAFNFGFGIKTRSTNWLGVRLDFRDYIGRSPSFGLARSSNDPTATVLPATGVINNGELSLGLVFYFGKR